MTTNENYGWPLCFSGYSQLFHIYDSIELLNIQNLKEINAYFKAWKALLSLLRNHKGSKNIDKFFWASDGCKYQKWMVKRFFRTRWRRRLTDCAITSNCMVLSMSAANWHAFTKTWSTEDFSHGLEHIPICVFARTFSEEFVPNIVMIMKSCHFQTIYTFLLICVGAQIDFRLSKIHEESNFSCFWCTWSVLCVFRLMWGELLPVPRRGWREFYSWYRSASVLSMWVFFPVADGERGKWVFADVREFFRGPRKPNLLARCSFNKFLYKKNICLLLSSVQLLP